MNMVVHEPTIKKTTNPIITINIMELMITAFQQIRLHTGQRVVLMV
ncbi:hypothetical protein [Fibrobacter sp. UWT3]|nr:hypothetical protein [Fibrobacter sp. UWT3]